MTAEVTLENKDIGFVHAGQEAAIKLERFPFTRYGTVPGVVELFRKAGGKPLALSAADTRALVRKEVARWSRTVRELDIKPE